jgi:hypothetical protein
MKSSLKLVLLKLQQPHKFVAIYRNAMMNTYKPPANLH